MSTSISKLNQIFLAMRNEAERILSGWESLQEVTEDDITRVACTQISYAPYQKCFTRNNKDFLIITVDEEVGSYNGYILKVDKTFNFGVFKIPIPRGFWK